MGFHTKFLVFTDLHVDIMPDSVARLQVILEAAEKHQVDFLLNLGDMMYPDVDFLQEHAPESIALREEHAWFVCDRDDEKKAIAKMLQDCGRPLYSVLGNHDIDSCTKKTACLYFHMPSPYYYFDQGGVRFIVLDTNFIKEDERYIDFDHCNYRDYKTDQTTWLTEEQFAFIETAVTESSSPCVLLSHSSLGDTRYSIHNMDRLHTLIKEMNTPQRRIILALNGHTHLDGVCVREGVPMMNINSASNVWLGHKYAAVRYSETISRLYPHIKGCAPYWDALFAIVEIDENAITVTGRSSSYVGPGPYKLGFPVQENYHERTSCIKDRIFPMAQMEDTDHLA